MLYTRSTDKAANGKDENRRARKSEAILHSEAGSRATTKTRKDSESSNMLNLESLYSGKKEGR